MASGKLSIAYIALFEDKYDDAEEFAQESYKYALEVNSRRAIFFSLELLAKLEWARGRSPAFLKYAEQALTWAEKLDENYISVVALHLLGTALHLGGEHSKARQKSKEALDLSLQDQFRGYYRDIYCWIFIQMGGALIQAQRTEQGVRLLGASDTIRRSTSMWFYPYEIREREGFIAKARAQLGDDVFEKAWAEGTAMSTEEAVKYALEESSK
jgi:tetratricopeptide (TPR) repeat protein